MNWILTDDDTLQHVKKFNDTDFRLVEMGMRNPDDGSCKVYADYISITDYLDDAGNADADLLSILQSFGYESAAHVRDIYGDSANQIMCECIFESVSSREGTSLFVGAEPECIGFITDYICEGEVKS